MTLVPAVAARSSSTATARTSSLLQRDSLPENIAPTAPERAVGAILWFLSLLRSYRLWGREQLIQGRGRSKEGDQARRMISLAHSCLWTFGVLFHIPGSLSPSRKSLGIIPEKQTYKRALQRRYLERTCVHACILLCTRGYTVVYTRVYSSLLVRRYSLGILD